MKLVERHYKKSNDELKAICCKSKDIYNKANYLIRQNYILNNEFIRYGDVDKLMQKEECYKQLPSKVSQQTLRLLDQNWKSFFCANKAFKENPRNFKSAPRPPKYLKKDGQYTTVYSNQAVSKKHILSKTSIKINTKKKFTEVRIIPKVFGHIIEVVYDKEEKKPKNSNNYCAIDLGVNNLAAITSNLGKPILVNGRIAKTTNQHYNKKMSKITSEKKRQQLIKKRYFRFENLFHHTSKFIIDYCNYYDIGKIIIGYNEGWKQNINIGKKNNQSFCYIPFLKLIEKLKYKCELEGIELVCTEESYTSKASALDNDPLDGSQLSGRRVKRGLYKCKDGFLLNADINGSLNIARKVIHESVVDRSLVARPFKVNALKNFDSYLL